MMACNIILRVSYNYIKNIMTYSGVFIAVEGVDGSGKSLK